jgi:hypothetical protein
MAYRRRMSRRASRRLFKRTAKRIKAANVRRKVMRGGCLLYTSPSPRD